MSENESRARSLPSPGVCLAAALLAGLAGFGSVYLTAPGSDNARAQVLSAAAARPMTGAVPAATSPVSLKEAARGAMAAFVVREEPAPLPPIEIVDRDGTPRPLSGWKGRIVLLNLWATWCAPCLKEMPSLDRLKGALGGPDFDVVALNIDRGGPAKPAKFMTDAGLKHLELLQDPTATAFVAMKSGGMPTTLLLDREGREIGRLVGPAEWDAPEAQALVKAALAQR